MIASLRRIVGIFLRQIYLIRRSPPRIISYCFWPTMDMIIWGFLNQYLYDKEAAVFSMSLFLGARLLYSFSERTQVQIMWGFLEDVWSRNLGNMLISPLRPLEMVAGFILSGLFSATLGIVCAYIVAYFMFDYTVIQLGSVVIPMLFILMVSAWWLGLLLVSLVLRFGASGEHFGWMAGFLLLPFIAVFYPVSALPEWAQHIAWVLPPTYVFESLRTVVDGQPVPDGYFFKALMLSAVYLVMSSANFVWQLNRARMRGGLFSMAE